MHNVFVKDPAQGAYSCFYAALHKEVIEKGWTGAYFTDAVSPSPIDVLIRITPLSADAFLCLNRHENGG